jgi:serine phosphatase RsbU (regulator of sigma subunit)
MPVPGTIARCTARHLHRPPSRPAAGSAARSPGIASAVASPTTIRGRLVRNIVAIIVILGATLWAVTYLGNRRAVETLSRSLIRRVSDQTEVRLRRFFEPVTRQLRIVTEWDRRGLLETEDPDRLNARLTQILRAFPQVSSCMVSDSRGREHMLLRVGERWRNRVTRRDADGDRVTWREWSDGDATPRVREETLEYDPRVRPWFQGAVAEARAAADAGEADRQPVHWTKPYTFFTTKDPGITASLAFRDADGIDHVVGFDVLLNDISSYTTGPDLAVSEGGRVFITEDETLEVLGLPRDPRFATEAARKAAVRTPVGELGVASVQEAVAAHRLQDAGAEPFRFDSGGHGWWGGVRAFPLSPDRVLRIGVVVPDSDLLGNLGTLRLWILLATLAALGVAVWRAFAMAGRFSRPIERLVAESERIRVGDLEEGEPIASNLREVQALADAQDRMRAGLKSLMKLERDLQVARQIQQNTFPEALPALANFDIDGWSEPADETGGDTYDVIGLQVDPRSASILLSESDAGHAVLLLADATGHGIGPALSVTQLRAMLRMLVRTGHDLGDIGRHVNEQLCQDLPGPRFITAWIGMLDADNSTLTAWSAGQAPLMHYHAAEDRFDVSNAHAPPLGVLPTIPIVIPEPLDLKPGDVYAVFSDGIYEAADPDEQRFGDERVQAVIRAHRDGTAEEILAAVRAAVDAFARGHPADDDRTGIVIKRR